MILSSLRWSRFGSLSIALSLAGSVVAQVPTDNPVASFYGEDAGYPVWTDEIRWDQVVDMSTYAVPGQPDADNFTKFEHARDAMHASGGGVLYYPAGTYTFVLPSHAPNGGRGLHLKSGVVIRGVAPVGDQFARPTAEFADDGVLPLPTKFVFETVSYKGGTVPKSSWNIVGITPGQGETGVKDVNRVGLAWVEIQYGTIFFGFEALWSSSPRTDSFAFLGGRTRHDAPNGPGAEGNWIDRLADGTHVADIFAYAPNPGGLTLGRSSLFVGEPDRLLVFGCSIVNGVPLNDFYYGSGRGANGGPGFLHPYRFAGRITIYGTNVFIGNNTLPMPTANFIRPEFVNSNSASATNNTGISFKNISDGGLVASGTTATVTVSGHGYANGSYVTVDRVAELEHVGLKGPITVLDANTFTYTVPEGAATVGTRAAAGNSMRLAQTFPQNILFDYANSIGIDVNKSMHGLTRPTDQGDKGYFARNVVIQDNFVFNRGNKSIEVSGNWVVLKNNYNRRFYLGFRMPDAYNLGGVTIGNTLDGWTYQGSGENSSDYLSRGYDLGGKNMWIDDNHVVNTGSTGNDGEGLLIQRHNNVETYSWAYTNNSTGNVSFGPGTSGETSYIGGYDVHHFGVLWAHNSTPGNIGHLKGISGGSNPSPNDLGNLMVDSSAFGNSAGNYNTGTGWDSRTAQDAATHPFAPHQEGQAGAFDYIGQGYDGTRGFTPPSSHPSQGPVHTDPVSAPTAVTATRLAGGEVEITYNDTADNEFGFRIQRRRNGGAWHTVAYRPRQSLLKFYRPLPEIEGDIGVGFPKRARQPRTVAANDGNTLESLRTDPWSDTPVWDLNPEQWIDFMAPPTGSLEYRVIALNGADLPNDDATEPAASMGRTVVQLGDAPPSPFADWMAAYEAVPANRRGPTDAASGDGLPNLLKFALVGLEPGRNDSATFPPAPVVSGSDYVVTFSKQTENAADLTFVVEALLGGTWTNVSGVTGFTILDLPGSIAVTLTPDRAHSIIRLRVTQ